MKNTIKVHIEAGYHDRDRCAVAHRIPNPDGKHSKLLQYNGLIDENDRIVSVQWAQENDAITMHFLTDAKVGDKKRYQLVKLEQDETDDGVRLTKGDQRIDVNSGGRTVTSYVYDKQYAKPYVGPVLAPDGTSYTRLDFDIAEHPHHRSIWVAIGDVNGIDFWNEPAGKVGKQSHIEFEKMEQGSVKAVLSANLIWTDFDGKPMLDERRTMHFYESGSDLWMMDIDIVLKAAYGPVLFGATKEAGPLGVRVHEQMKADAAGTMINSYGGISEDECWGRRAHWCDYYGPVNERVRGIAVYDHPENEYYPTYWHIRNYGLMAPNNFHFVGSRPLEPEQSVRYRYRILFHEGDVNEAKVAQRFHDYINPPSVHIDAVD